MHTQTNSLPYPGEEFVKSYINRFDQTYAVVERALAKLFRLFPENTALEDVLLKVIALNDLYRTVIWATYKVAEHIVSLGIDPLIMEGRAEAVALVARVPLGDRTFNFYSFATKYCAWHNPGAYPIYDGFVDQMLWTYRKQDNFDTFCRKDLWEYPRFNQIISNFRAYYHLAAYNLKDIDKFLWLAGKEYFPSY